jgi:exonuclease SbcD
LFSGNFIQMKIIHTSDWHLGRQFHNVSLLDDQKYVLDQVVEITKDFGAEVVVISGDVYDRSVPPAEAVALLDETLHRLTSEADAAIVMIAGNHDGAIRLAQGSREMEASRVFVSGPLTKSYEPVIVDDGHGPVYFCVLPYADPTEVRIEMGSEEIRTHGDAIDAMGKRMLDQVPEGTRSVAIAHCWVEGGTSSESERPLTVGGTGQVDAKCFEGFNYTALGHLHRPQTVNDQIRYAGSLLKYSFSEIDHVKSIDLVELAADGSVSYERTPLIPRRELRLVEGLLDDVIIGAEDDPASDDYLLVRLSDEGAILDAMGQLRQVYPNTLHIERPGLLFAEGSVAGVKDHRQRSELDLFKDFYRQIRNQELSTEQEAVISNVVEEVRQAEREVTS